MAREGPAARSSLPGGILIFRPVFDFDHGGAAYVFGGGGKGLGAVLDPRTEDVEAYAAFAASKGLRIAHVVDTHVHADHRSGGPALAAVTGAKDGLHRVAEVAVVPAKPEGAAAILSFNRHADGA